MGAVGDRQIVAMGTPEVVWQSWPELSALPQAAPTELVPPGSRAVVIAPHPDDEVLGTGGLISQLAQSGAEIVLVAVTDGGASHPGSARWTTGKLEYIRCVERRDAMATLTADRHRTIALGLPDGGLQRHLPALEQSLSNLLQPTDTVFATWRYDGHPDHEAVGQAARTCCARAGAKLVEVPIWMWHWAHPDDPRVPWHRAVRLAIPPQYLALKQLAVRQHRSQLEPDPSTGQEAVLTPWILDRLMRPTETFFI